MALVDPQVGGALGARVFECVAALHCRHLARSTLPWRLIVHAVELDLVPLLHHAATNTFHIQVWHVFYMHGCSMMSSRELNPFMKSSPSRETQDTRSVT